MDFFFSTNLNNLDVSKKIEFLTKEFTNENYLPLKENDNDEHIASTILNIYNKGFVKLFNSLCINYEKREQILDQLCNIKKMLIYQAPEIISIKYTSRITDLINLLPETPTEWSLASWNYILESSKEANIALDNFNAKLDSRKPYLDGNPIYAKNEIKGKYIIIDKRKNTVPNYSKKDQMLFPRMWSNTQSRHASGYKNWGGLKSKDDKPTFSQNLTFFFKYQIGWSYLRYFM